MTLPGQMELATVIRHERTSIETGDTHKPAGVRLAKALVERYAPGTIHL